MTKYKHGNITVQISPFSTPGHCLDAYELSFALLWEMKHQVTQVHAPLVVDIS